MKMTGSREGFGYDKPLWKQTRVHLLRFLDHIATEKKKYQAKTSENQKQKKGPKIGLLHSSIG